MATFCLLHGDWHDGACWNPLLGPLRARGHEAVAPDLPLDDPATGFEARVGPALEALQGVSGSIVVVGHSASSGYAAFVAHSTPGSLLVHLCPRLGPFRPRPGAPDTFRKGFRFPGKDAAGMVVWDAEAAIESMYPRLGAEQARALAERLRPGAPAPQYPLDGHPRVPTVLVYAADDEIFDPAWERFMAHELLGIGAIEIPGGHFPMLEDPDALADLLDRLAREHPARP